MSEQVPVPAAPQANPDRYKTLVVILTILTTVITAVVAGISADAGIRASIANRDSQLYAIQVQGELYRESVQVAYDTDTFASYLIDEEESTVLQLTALQQETAGEKDASQATLLRALLAGARAEAAKKFCIFYTDPRYAAASESELPNMDAYLADSSAPANALVEKQNAAADDYGKWNRKGDVYTSILAVLAVSFLLFGLAQALSPQLRLLFAIFGAVLLAGAVFWAFLVILI